MHTAVRAENDARTKDMVGRRKRRGRGRDDLVCQQTPSGAQLPYLAVILAQFLTLILSTGDGARERQVRAAANSCLDPGLELEFEFELGTAG